jgi:ubiquinone/menaquinone biosynthesis C-methylase UbiE
MDRWEDVYEGRPPWDIGRPQPAFVKLFQDGEIKRGHILDVGCGTGENALYLAENGCDVTGVDIAHRAIGIAKEKAAKRNVKVDFFVCDVLTLGSCFLEGAFDIVIDSGLFHTLADEERPIFLEQVYRLLKSEGAYFMMCFSDKEPGEWGPRRVSKEEIVGALEPLFHINYIRDAAFESLTRRGGSKAYLVSANKK